MNTKHNADCRRVFKNYDLSCPRCIELKNGAQARAGWNDSAKRFEHMRNLAVQQHDFSTCAKINGVCTHFDY